MCFSEKSLAGRFASHTSLLTAIAPQPTAETWAHHPGISWQPQTRNWQPFICCLLFWAWLSGLLTACCHCIHFPEIHHHTLHPTLPSTHVWGPKQRPADNSGTHGKPVLQPLQYRISKFLHPLYPHAHRRVMIGRTSRNQFPNGRSCWRCKSSIISQYFPPHTSFTDRYG